MIHLVEIHASYIGIGKSKFIKKFPFPSVYNCIDFVECFDEWYTKSLCFNQIQLDEITKSLLVMENLIGKIETKNNSLIMASRSPIISAFQFLSVLSNIPPSVADKFINFYKKRIQKNVSHVTIIDFGTVISKDDKCIQLGYERMLQRNRKLETNYFIDLEFYKNFFQVCEHRKQIIVNKIKQDDFFTYILAPSFHDFNLNDYKYVLKQIF